MPPIKSQGIKTKLVPLIKEIVPEFKKSSRWVEPFLGTGVVCFNLKPDKAVLVDSNPYLISFYQSIKEGKITALIVKNFLEKEGALLLKDGESHYYKVRERFNTVHNPLDFLFLNRAGFNGMIRFNKKGGYNVPFCRKPNRFAPAYVTKITNQVIFVENLIKNNMNYDFKVQDFVKTLGETSFDDIIYCDPPYIGRHVDYYNGWNENNEIELKKTLEKISGRFILSTWHHNDFRKNEYIDKLWKDFYITTREHFYHVGGHEKNRNPMIEALITNFKV